MDLEFGNLRRVTIIKVNGNTTDSMERGFLSIEIVLTKENLKIF